MLIAGLCGHLVSLVPRWATHRSRGESPAIDVRQCPLPSGILLTTVLSECTRGERRWIDCASTDAGGLVLHSFGRWEFILDSQLSHVVSDNSDSSSRINKLQLSSPRTVRRWAAGPSPWPPHSRGVRLIRLRHGAAWPLPTAAATWTATSSGTPRGHSGPALASGSIASEAAEPATRARVGGGLGAIKDELSIIDEVRPPPSQPLIIWALIAYALVMLGNAQQQE